MRKHLLFILLWASSGCRPSSDARFSSYVVDPTRQPLQLYYQDEQGRRFGSLGRLRDWLTQRHDSLRFAMNGGMYAPGGRPQGLFIENGRTLVPLDTASGTGNFYLWPNGVFTLTRTGQASICATGQFRPAQAIAYATQSGPLLLHCGQLHPAFTPSSANVAVRNGVGILPDGRVVFALSREKVNFYDFARYFQRLGCREALYLDGYVSRLYWPAGGWRQTDGDFGVIIGVAGPAGR